METLKIQRVESADSGWVTAFIKNRWHDAFVVAHGEVFYPAELTGFIARYEDEPDGLITYRIKDDECEIVTLDSLIENRGVGTRLIREVLAEAGLKKCRRVWLITTNDNTRAISFYRNRGFRIAAIYRGALDVSRKLKPSIPLENDQGIPIRDEIELEYPLEPL
jgi:ribosomal protein S18 acetylase RimI-like enzyme